MTGINLLKSSSNGHPHTIKHELEQNRVYWNTRIHNDVGECTFIWNRARIYWHVEVYDILPHCHLEMIARIDQCQ